MTMTRTEHLAWCKQRALELLNAGKVHQAVTSMLSDIRKHPETADKSAPFVAMATLQSGNARQAREFIEGFN